MLVLDEVHRLDDPSRLLKIAADAYPGLRVLATGPSTLAATRKFRDALTGRKEAVHLCPVPWDECAGWLGAADLDRRLLHGGLPEPLLAARKEPAFFGEWMDSFYARDVLELFGVRNRRGFLALFRVLLRQSGGQLDYGRLATLSEMSRPTVMSHVQALATAHAVHLLRPFHGGGAGEIVRRPRCYAFDTGFVTFEKGWDRIRDDDRGGDVRGVGGGRQGRRRGVPQTGERECERAAEALGREVADDERDVTEAVPSPADVAKAIYGPGTDLAEQWARDRRAEFDAGRLCAVVAALRIHVETTPEARNCIHYLFGNRHRIALSAVPRQGPVRLVGRRRGRMQAARRPAQARRHALLDRRRRQRHHRPALLHPQRTLRGLLGATSRECRLTLISQ